MIKFENVGKVYPDGTVALVDVSVEIPQGDFVAIIGLSGAGKSTLIKLINKMIPVTNGHLTVARDDLQRMLSNKIKKRK